ncbi:MAG: GNAT family N-acetyltransferase [Actinomycetota bacterium]
MSIRLKELGGGFRDLLGILESETEVRKRSGQLVTFDPNRIHLWKVVEPITQKAGKGQPFSLRVREIEIAAAQTWPPVYQESLGDWTLRASGKFTMRANSVLVLGDPGIPLKSALSEVADFYSFFELIPVLHIPLPIFSELDSELDKDGWVAKTEALVMICDIESQAISDTTPKKWSIKDNFDDEWISLQKDQGVSEIMQSAPALYASLHLNSQLVATGRASNYQEWTTLSRLYVAEAERGRGFGRELITRLLQAAHANGATKALLQVDVKNTHAIQLYESMGFTTHHSYRYRALENLPSKTESC